MLANVTSEPFTLIMGFHMNNVGWKVFLESGMVFGPFIIMFLRNYIKAKTGGKDEGPLGDLLLSYIEADLYKMVVVLVFCVIPVASGGTAQSTQLISYSCSAKNLTSGNDLNDYSVLGGITESNPKVQMWWWLTHEVSTYITNYMVANVPCAGDFRFAQVAFNAEKIKNPQSQVFANEFYRQCFSPAMSNIVKNSTSNIDDRADLWAGSDKAKAEYAKETSVMTIGKDYWVSNAGGSADLDPARGPEAYPSCSTAYSHFESLIDKEVERLNEESWVNNLLRFDSSLKEELIRKTMASASVMQSHDTSKTLQNNLDEITGSSGMMGAGATDSSGNWFADTALAIGGTVKNWGASIDAIAYRTMAPHLVSAVQMIILAVTPVLLIAGGLNISTVGALTGWYFAAEFTLVIEELGYWFDNMMGYVLAYNTGVFAPGSRGEAVVLKLLGNFSYQWFPVVWLALISVIGVKSVGSSMAGTAGVSSGSGGTVTSVAKGAAGGIKGAAEKMGKSTTST